MTVRRKGQPRRNPKEGITQQLQLAPQLAFLAAHTVHGSRDVLEVHLQLTHQGGAILSLPQPPLIKGHGAGFFNRFQSHLTSTPPSDQIRA